MLKGKTYSLVCFKVTSSHTTECSTIYWKIVIFIHSIVIGTTKTTDSQIKSCSGKRALSGFLAFREAFKVGSHDAIIVSNYSLVQLDA